jgi:hypothetical protein
MLRLVANHNIGLRPQKGNYSKVTTAILLAQNSSTHFEQAEAFKVCHFYVDKMLTME